MIDKSSPIPVYYQLKEDIKRKISEGVWKVGKCIDSERELSEGYGVSRMTIRQALGELVHEGILVRKKGKGTFVCEPKVKQKDMMSFSEIVSKLGMRLKTEIISFDTINTPEEMEEVFPFEHVYKINRMRIVDNEAVANEVVYIPCDYCGYMDKDMLKGSLFDILKKFGYSIQYAESSIEAIIMDDELKALFRLEDQEPLLKNVSKNKDINDKVIFIEEAIYRSDKYILEVNISRREGIIK
ncbi:GntR family transcriptional regulator [Clostridium hydrogeniformans]|uniref:GntR family transcriptional regulator n=1 Tax=Clostridium hydrogeniformans TaxID=349933 RepID=UPI000484459D|nr:GntR family transcriptional regulator [Clostridium hydrogeniformans]